MYAYWNVTLSLKYASIVAVAMNPGFFIKQFFQLSKLSDSLLWELVLEDLSGLWPVVVAYEYMFSSTDSSV